MAIRSDSPRCVNSWSRRLTEHGTDASPNQILLTNGISSGIDLVARYLVRPDDVVLVDDPGHFRRFGHMRALGATVQGVPMTDTGPGSGPTRSHCQDTPSAALHHRSDRSQPDRRHHLSGNRVQAPEACRALRLLHRRRRLARRGSPGAAAASGRPRSAQSSRLRQQLLRRAVGAAPGRHAGRAPGPRSGPDRPEAS